MREHFRRMTLRDMLILYPVLLAIAGLILWYGPDSFRTTVEVVVMGGGQ